MEDKPVLKMPMEEWPDDKPIAPPDGSEIIQPFRDLTRFWPNDQWDRDDVNWVEPFERRYIQPLGMQVANIFQVDLIDDADYLSMPEEARASFLSCVMTRSQVREVASQTFGWNPICVVVRQFIMVAVEMKIHRPSGKIEIPKCLLWSKHQQTYAPVFDEVTGRIENPGVILQILDRYARLEGFIQ